MPLLFYPSCNLPRNQGVPMPILSAVRGTNSTTIVALAEQLREGPLKCVANLHARIRTLAAPDTVRNGPVS
jgi:hypothetical protein